MNFVNRKEFYLVDFGAKELLALEFEVSRVTRLRTLDADFSAKLDPWNCQNAATEPARKRDDIFFIMVKEGYRTLAKIVNSNLKNKYLFKKICQMKLY